MALRMATQDVRGAPVTVFKNLPASLRELFVYWFTFHADRVWLVYEGEHYTFGETLNMFNAVGAELAASFGVKAGDRVGIAMRNYPEFLLVRLRMCLFVLRQVYYLEK